MNNTLYILFLLSSLVCSGQSYKFSIVSTIDHTVLQIEYKNPSLETLIINFKNDPVPLTSKVRFPNKIHSDSISNIGSYVKLEEFLSSQGLLKEIDEKLLDKIFNPNWMSTSDEIRVWIEKIFIFQGYAVTHHVEKEPIKDQLGIYYYWFHKPSSNQASKKEISPLH